MFGLILTLAAALRILSFRGYTTYDAAEYTRLAHMLVSGDFRIGMLWCIPPYSARVGLFAPVALAFRLGGVSELMLTAYPFLLSMAGVLVSYLAARAMYGLRGGLVAAGLAALLPIDVLFASVVLPDMPAAFWMNAGLLLVYVGSRRSVVSGKVTMGALAGAGLFASWLCKETVLYLLPFVVLYLVWLAARDRRNLTLLLAIGVIAAILVAFESWIYHRYAGDCLHRYHVIVGGADRVAPVLTVAGIARYFVYRVSEVARNILLNPYFAFLPVTALAASVYAVIRRSRRLAFPALWFCWLLLVFGFGSESLSAYRPLNLFMVRYLYPMLLPAVLLAAGLISSLLFFREPGQSGKRRRARLLYGVLVSVYLAGTSLVMVALGARSRRGPDSMGLTCWGVRQMARVVAPADPVYTDPHTASALEFFWGFPATDSTHDFERMAASQIPSEAYVLLNRDELAAMRCNFRYRPPEFTDSVPYTWRKLREKDNTALYRVPPAPASESAR